MDSPSIEVCDRFERHENGVRWFRKIGGGEWELIDENAPVILLEPTHATFVNGG